MFAIYGEPHLVVGDIPGLDADHTAPRGVAEVHHGGGLLSPGIPHHARGGADFFDDDAVAPPAIFDGASPRRVEVDPVGLCRDGDERGGLRLAPRRVRLVDVGGAGEPGDRDGADIGDREVGVQRLLEGHRMRRAVLHGEAQRQGRREGHGIGRAKQLRPERRADVAVAETEGQGQGLAAGGFDPVEMPSRGARKAVLRRCRRVPVGAERRGLLV